MDKLTADLVANLNKQASSQYWNPWDPTPRSLDQPTLEWLMSGGLDGSMGIRDGYRYQAGNGGPGGWRGGDAGDWFAAEPTTQWDRIAVDDQGRDIGRDFEAYDQSGKYTHGWISGGQTLLDKIAPFIPVVAAAFAGMPGLGLGEATAGAGELTAAELAGEGIFGGGLASSGGGGLGGLEGLISSMGGSPFALGLEGGALSMPAFGSVLPAAGALTGAGSLTGAANSGGGFLDKLSNNSSDFFSKPQNLLNTVGTIGALYENSKDPDPVNQTQNTTSTVTRNLDPSISNALFGADRQGGLLGQMQGYFNKYPTGQNETMRDAQSGLRGLLGNPDVLSSLYKAGAAGQGLLTGGANAGAKPWWWKG